FSFLFAHNPLPMWVYDLETLRFLEVNNAATAHYGYSFDEFASMRISDIRAPEDPGSANAAEARHRLKSGRIIAVVITSYVLEWRDRKAMLVVAQDVTEQKRLQKEFLMAQKMEAIGTLAAGVAHDFNNLLTVVNGYCRFVLDKLKEDDPIYEEIC